MIGDPCCILKGIRSRRELLSWDGSNSSSSTNQPSSSPTDLPVTLSSVNLLHPGTHKHIVILLDFMSKVICLKIQKGIAPGVGKAKLEMVVFAAMLKDRGLQKFSALKFVSRNVDGQLSNVQRSVTGANMSDIQSHTSTCTMASANCSSAPTNAVTNTK